MALPLPTPHECSAIGGDGEATVTWSVAPFDPTANSEPEKAHVTKYRWQGNEWRKRGLPLVAPKDATSFLVTGLPNNALYRFSVCYVCAGLSPGAESPMSEAIVPNPPIPAPWIENQDPNTGKPFYYNPTTRVRQWNFPVTHIPELGEDEKKLFCHAKLYELDATFLETDADGSGTIDIHELRALVEKTSNTKVTLKKVRKLMRQVDTSGDGEVNFSEFVQLVHVADTEHGGLSSALGNGFGKFANAAKYVLGHKERNKEKERQHKLELAQKMGQWTIQTDPMLRSEYYFNKVTQETSWSMPDDIKWFVPKDLKEVFGDDEIENLKTEFKTFDIDSSGSIDVDELMEIVNNVHKGKRVKRSKVEKMIKQIDIDGNGEIGFNEFVRMVHDIEHGKSYGITSIRNAIVKNPKLQRIADLALGVDVPNSADPSLCRSLASTMIREGEDDSHSETSHKHRKRKSHHRKGGARIELDDLKVKQMISKYKDKSKKHKKRAMYLESELRELRMHTIPCVPTHAFLREHGLHREYAKRLDTAKITNTKELFNLIESAKAQSDAEFDSPAQDLLMQIGIKIGHKRKLKVALRKLALDTAKKGSISRAIQKLPPVVSRPRPPPIA